MKKLIPVVIFMISLWAYCFVWAGQLDGGLGLLGLPDNIKVGTDPDVNKAGNIGADTDDHLLRGFDGTSQFVYGAKIKIISLRVPDPENSHTWTGRANPSFPFWPNESGTTFVITEIHAVSDTDNYDFNIFESASNVDMSDENDTLVDLVECETNGTECFTDTETTISHSVIAAGHWLIWEHAAGVAGDLLIAITGYFDGDVP